MAIANQEMIRDNNRRLVLEYIVNNPPIPALPWPRSCT